METNYFDAFVCDLWRAIVASLSSWLSYDYFLQVYFSATPKSR